MYSLTGTIIRSKQDINDPNFENTTLLIVEHNENGALGFILHLPFERCLNELVDFTDAPPIPLYIGGPMDQEHLFLVHRKYDLLQTGALIKDNIYSGGTARQITDLLQQGKITEKDFILFIGYAGWDPGQLEEEISEGSWIVTEQSILTAFE